MGVRVDASWDPESVGGSVALIASAGAPLAVRAQVVPSVSLGGGAGAWSVLVSLAAELACGDARMAAEVILDVDELGAHPGGTLGIGGSLGTNGWSVGLGIDDADGAIGWLATVAWTAGFSLPV